MLELIVNCNYLGKRQSQKKKKALIEIKHADNKQGKAMSMSAVLSVFPLKNENVP